MPKLNILIPMKDPRQSKQRLKPVLSDKLRQHLALSLFENSLRFFQTYFREYHLSVITPSSMIASLTRSYGFHALLERSDISGLNQALAQAQAWSLAQGFDAQLILPADIADLRVAEMTRLLACQSRQGVVIVPSQDGGTNALLTSPIDAIPLAYGPESAAKHQALALAGEYSCQMLDLAGLSRDIDMPLDLADGIGKQFLGHITGQAADYIQTGGAYVR